MRLKEENEMSKLAEEGEKMLKASTGRMGFDSPAVMDKSFDVWAFVRADNVVAVGGRFQDGYEQLRDMFMLYKDVDIGVVNHFKDVISMMWDLYGQSVAHPFTREGLFAPGSFEVTRVPVPVVQNFGAKAFLAHTNVLNTESIIGVAENLTERPGVCDMVIELVIRPRFRSPD